MPILKCPAAIINRIEKLQRDFLWQGCEESKKIRLVNWKIVCSPKDSSGLGIRPLRNMNQALLGKWLWRLGKDSDGLWRSILIDKYKVRRNGWDISPPSQMCSTFQKGIYSIKDNFANSIRYRVGNREKISFWQDIWAADSPLAFAWLALQSKTRTMDNLRRRNMIVVNACPLCLANEELVDHLLLHCRLTKSLCSSIFKDFSCSWFLPGYLNSFRSYSKDGFARFLALKGRPGGNYLFWLASGRFGKKETRCALKGSLAHKKT